MRVPASFPRIMVGMQDETSEPTAATRGRGRPRTHGLPGMRKPMVQLSTRVPASLVQQLKVWCVEREISVMQFVADALREKLRRAGKRTS
jgi:hypothetical protein